MSKPRRAALYLRVSTDDQSTALQRRELIQACKHRGWTVTEVYEDAGASGAKGRPAFDRLCQDATRRRFDVIAAWSVDRLGRSLAELDPLSRATPNAVHATWRINFLPAVPASCRPCRRRHDMPPLGHVRTLHSQSDLAADRPPLRA